MSPEQLQQLTHDLNQAGLTVLRSSDYVAMMRVLARLAGIERQLYLAVEHNCCSLALVSELLALETTEINSGTSRALAIADIPAIVAEMNRALLQALDRGVWVRPAMLTAAISAFLGLCVEGA